MRSHNPRHYLLYLNLALFLVLLLQIGFYLLIFPQVAVNKIELDSDLALSDADVLKLLGFYSAQNYYSIDTNLLSRRAKSFALVDQITIEKQFPDRLRVRLKSRKPVLVMLQRLPQGKDYQTKNQKQTKNNRAEQQWQSVPILVDAEGVMFQVGLGGYHDVPVLSGLEFSPGSPLNSRLPRALHPLVAALGTLKKERPQLYAIISEVRAQMRTTDIETDIYLQDWPSYIKTSGKIDAQIVETALIALEILRRSKEHTPFLDMRTTGIVYRPGTPTPQPAIGPRSSAAPSSRGLSATAGRGLSGASL